MARAEVPVGHPESATGAWPISFTYRNLTSILLLLLVLEAVLFCWSFSTFFGSDSIFFFARRIESLDQTLPVLTSTDDRGHYRPLTLIFFSYVLYPLFRLNPLGYHFVPLIFHFANTLLVFGILRRLLSQPLAIVAGTFFFGLHAINFFITYSITFLPDFTYAFFYLVAVFCFLRHEETVQPRWLFISLAAFALSLLCKEASVTLPAVLVLCGIARFCRLPRPTGWRGFWRKAASALGGYFLILAAYLCFLGFIKHGAFYPSDPRNPYRASLSASNLVDKAKYVWWGLNLPAGTGQLKGHPRFMALLGRFVPDRVLAHVGEVSNVFARPASLLKLVLMLPLVIILIVGIFARWRSEPMITIGAVWFVVALSPVLLLAVKTMRHNLYIPLVGAAAMMGIAVQFAGTWLERRRAGLAMPLFTLLLVTFFSSSALAVHNNLRFSWVSRASLVAENSLRDLQRMHPALPEHATLYLMDNNDEDIFFLYEGGNLFRLFYHSSRLDVLFKSRGRALPTNFLTDPSVFVLAYYDTHLYDLTGWYRDEAQERRNIKLMDQFGPDRISVNEQEPYPVKGFFGSPGNKPAFLYLLARSGDCRPSLVTLAGARVLFTVSKIDPDSTLRFGAAMVHDLGDGALGSVWITRNGKKELLYSRYLNPAQKQEDRQWFDAQVDLGRYAPGPIDLSFECSSGDSGNTGADWFAWSRLKICCPRE